jgi:hypothetical protein
VPCHRSLSLLLYPTQRPGSPSTPPAGRRMELLPSMAGQPKAHLLSRSVPPSPTVRRHPTPPSSIRSVVVAPGWRLCVCVCGVDMPSFDQSRLLGRSRPSAARDG